MHRDIARHHFNVKLLYTAQHYYTLEDLTGAEVPAINTMVGIKSLLMFLLVLNYVASLFKVYLYYS